MNECTISVESTCEEVADFFLKSGKINEEEKNILIKEEISGDILLYIENFKALGIRSIPAKKLKEYINYYKDKFTPKDTSENISIKNEQEIKNFFEKYIRFKGDLNGIKNENELKQLKEEDMEKMGLNLGQRIKLLRYIYNLNYIKEQNIIITITENSTYNEITDYLKNQLNISEESINKIGFDTESLFKLTFEEVNDFLKDGDILLKESEKLKLFIKKRDELEKKKEESKENFNIIKKIEANNIESEKINFSILEQKSFPNEANYNIFFIVTLKKENLTNLQFSIFQNKSSIFSYSYIIYQSYLINTFYNTNNIYFLLFKVLSDEPVQKLSIIIKDKDEDIIYFEKEKTFKNIESDINNDINNIFILENLNTKTNYSNTTELSNNELFTQFLNYFFVDSKAQITNVQKHLIDELNLKISETKNIELSSYNILKFLFCLINLHKDPINLDNIVIINPKEKLDKNLYIPIELIKEYSGKKRKMIITLLIKIFYLSDVEYMLNIIDSENDDYCRIFFDLINPYEIIKFEDLKKVMNDNQIIKLQNNLFKVAKEKDEINFIIKMRKGIENNLSTIKENIEFLLPIIKKERKKKFYGLNLDIPDINDNFKNILSDFIYIIEELGNFNPFNMNDIFDKMIDTYNRHDLDDYLLLKKLISYSEIRANILDKYYKKIHEKGMNMIKENKMKTEEILNFIFTKDIFYCCDNYSDNENRDPSIFSNIYISNKSKDYKNNIEILKKYKIYNLFEKSKPEIQEIFYNAFLDQIDNLIDVNIIFEIFPNEYIKDCLLILINKKIDELIYSVLDYKDIDLVNSYSIINKWIFINYQNENKTELEKIGNTLYEIDKFTISYYFYLLKTKDNEQIINIIKKYIIEFFDHYNKDKYLLDENFLINIFKNSLYYDFNKDFLNKMERKILTEKDFYTKKENDNLEFFGLFIENYPELMNKGLKGCNYIKGSLETTSKIISDLKYKNIEYEILNNLISNDDKKFLDKLKIIENNQAEEIFQELKESLSICREKLRQLDLIKEYYNLFYKESKKVKITLINDKLKELKCSYISIILNEKNFFENNPNIDIEKAKEDAKNIKYSKSKLFMALYEKNKNDYNIKKQSEYELFYQTLGNPNIDIEKAKEDAKNIK